MRRLAVYAGAFVLLTAALYPLRNRGELSWLILLIEAAAGAAVILGIALVLSRAKDGSWLGRLRSRLLDDD